MIILHYFVGRVSQALPIGVNLRNETLVGGVSNPDFMPFHSAIGVRNPSNNNNETRQLNASAFPYKIFAFWGVKCYTSISLLNSVPTS